MEPRRTKSREDAEVTSATMGKRRGYYVYVTEACNLRCDYCFVRDKHNQRHLTDEMANSVLAFIARDAEGMKDIYVHFFGGEPLIRAATVDRMAAGLRAWSQDYGVGLRLGITTNGTLLTAANCEILKRHDIGVQLSLDGAKKGNDVHRQLMGGTQRGLPAAGAFDLVQIDNYIAYFGRQCPNCRMTLTVHNLPYLSESMRELHERGFKSFSIIPDGDCGAWTAAYLVQYAAEMRTVFEYWARHPDIRVNTIQQTMQKLVAKNTRPHLCPAGRGVVGITVNGDIYPCHDFAGRFWSDEEERANLLIGNVATGFRDDTGKIRDPIETADAKPGSGHDCELCWAKWVCAKGCPYMNYAQSRDMRTVNATYCATTRINASLALEWMSILRGFRFVDTSRRPAERSRRIGSPEGAALPVARPVLCPGGVAGIPAISSPAEGERT